MNAKLLVSAVIGAAVGVGVGYAVYALGQHSFYPSAFIDWLTDKRVGRPTDALLWAAIGAAIAAGMRFILKKH